MFVFDSANEGRVGGEKTTVEKHVLFVEHATGKQTVDVLLGALGGLRGPLEGYGTH